jgi:branched-subunit amino acid ABC-type transport system permease component
MLLFVGARFGDNVPKLAKENARPLRQTFLIHLIFLGILLGVFELAADISSYLPDWLTGETIDFRGVTFSGLEIMLVVSFCVLLLVERRYIYSR